MSKDANSLSRIVGCILMYLHIVNPKQKTDVTSVETIDIGTISNISRECVKNSTIIATRNDFFNVHVLFICDIELFALARCLILVFTASEMPHLAQHFIYLL